MPDAILPFCENINFNAQHSPAGAFASFTCGHFGTAGGFGIQIGKPGDQGLYVGIKQGDRRDDAPIICLPFFEPPKTNLAASFLVEQVGPPEQHGTAVTPTYPAEQIRRQYGWATDRWTTPDFEFAIYTPFPDLPDPKTADARPMAEAVCPAVIAEMVIDNTAGKTPKTAFFSLGIGDPGVRLLDQGIGFAHRNGYGIRAEAKFDDNSTAEPFVFMRWTPDGGLKDVNPFHMLGNNPGIGIVVPAGQRCSLRLALGVHVAGDVTSGIVGRYFYNRYFHSIEDVLDSAISRFDALKHDAGLRNTELANSNLNPHQQFLISHSTRSYYGSTQLLEVDGKPFWIVNEGEYCMINTLDLAVDQVFWELQRNPWVVRNLLNSFITHYSYVDEIVKREDGVPKLRPGGLSFCHDMGLRNQFSPKGQSSYEIPHQNATCFSFMTAEQLCNWTIMAVSYLLHTRNTEWAKENAGVLAQCLDSLRARGDSNHFPAFDSSRCGSDGAEITTYDSLDHSLAQTRNNVYMIVKCWSAYVGLATVFEEFGLPDAAVARQHADRIADALPHHLVNGEYPAVLEPSSSGFASRILPAIEALSYLAVWKLNKPEPSPAAARLLDSLREHTRRLLTSKDSKNLFADGGLKLSSTSNNSWMSKIALFQFAARQTLGLGADAAVSRVFQQADSAHARWQTNSASAYWAMSDQMVLGQASGSRYYPRCITSALWMTE